MPVLNIIIFIEGSSRRFAAHSIWIIMFNTKNLSLFSAPAEKKGMPLKHTVTATSAGDGPDDTETAATLQQGGLPRRVSTIPKGEAARTRKPEACAATQ